MNRFNQPGTREHDAWLAGEQEQPLLEHELVAMAEAISKRVVGEVEAGLLFDSSEVDGRVAELSNAMLQECNIYRDEAVDWCLDALADHYTHQHVQGGYSARENAAS